MTDASRQAHRRAQFAAAVIAAGWLSVDEYVTAVINERQRVYQPSAQQLQYRRTSAARRRETDATQKEGEK